MIFSITIPNSVRLAQGVAARKMLTPPTPIRLDQPPVLGELLPSGLQRAPSCRLLFST